MLSAHSLDQILVVWADVSILQPLTTVLPLGKGLFVYPISILALGSVFLLYGLLLTRPGRLVRLVILVGFLLVLISPIGFRKYSNSMNMALFDMALFDQIQIVNLPSIPYEEIFSKEHVTNANIETEEDFYEFSRQRYLANRDYLMKKWRIEDEQRLQAIFYMNLVSHLWGYGNVKNPDKPGCVLHNEETEFEIVNDPTIQTYLKSDIGCCTDYAHVLNILLDRCGIENRQVSVKGHIFNEVRLKGDESNRDGWVTLDANTNMLFEGSWASIQSRESKGANSVHLTIFPHQNLVEQDNPFYRPDVGRFRYRWIVWTLAKNAPPLGHD